MQKMLDEYIYLWTFWSKSPVAPVSYQNSTKYVTQIG